jgi:hypothetical protein
MSAESKATAAWAQQFILQLKKALATQTASTTDVSSIQTTIDGMQATIDALQAVVDAGGAGLTAQQQFLISLIAAVDTISGSVAERNKTAFDWAQQAAHDAGLGMLKAHVDTGNGRTAVIAEQIVRKTADDSLALQVNAVNASFGISEANVTAIMQAYSNGDTAAAIALNAVGSTVAGNMASVTALQSSVNGINARWGIAVNANGQVLGVVQLDGSASGSTFTVVANNYQVCQPSTTGGDPIQVFTIGSVAGTPQLGIRANMFLDGSIVARNLAVSTLSAITADIGTCTAGKIQSADGKFLIDLTNKVFQITT